MTRRTIDIPLTALAPITWGSTYYVTTEFLPADRPILIAAIRALPAGLVLLAAHRSLPDRIALRRLAVLSMFNFGAFMPLLFLAASRLPGGAAAACGAVQPLVVLGLGRVLLGDRPVPVRWLAAAVAAAGVALVVLRPTARLDPLGIVAALGATVSMGCGVVLARRWLVAMPGIVAAGWQLTISGVGLAVLAVAVEGAPPSLTWRNAAGFMYLGLIGTALAYALWFRGIARVGASTASLLGLASPLVATVIGWVALDQRLGTAQLVGYAIACAGIAVGARAGAMSNDLALVRDHGLGASAPDSPPMSPTDPTTDGTTTARTEAPKTCPSTSPVIVSDGASSSSRR